MKIIFSKNLLSLRKEAGISQEELASKLFVTRQTISKWELGEVTPDLGKIQLIAEYFNTPVEELLFGKEINKNTSKTKDKVNQLFEEDDTDKDWHQKHQWREWQYKPINNGWEFLARYYWILFALAGMIWWFSRN